jgi:hypothetical protein
MDPHRPLQDVDVVHQNQDVRGLIQQKGMPRRRHVGRVIGDRHTKDELRSNDSDTCA